MVTRKRSWLIRSMAPMPIWRYLKSKGILFAGKPLGRPNKVTAANRQELQRLKAPAVKTTGNGFRLKATMGRARTV